MSTITISTATKAALRSKAKSLGMSTNTAAELILSQATGVQPFRDVELELGPHKPVAPNRDMLDIKSRLAGRTTIGPTELAGTGKAQQMLYAKIMRSLGWSITRFMRKGIRERVWLAPGYRIENGKAVSIEAETEAVTATHGTPCPVPAPKSPPGGLPGVGGGRVENGGGGGCLRYRGVLSVSELSYKTEGP